MRRGLTAALALAAGLYGCTFLLPLGDLTGSTPVAQPVVVVPDAGMVPAPTGNAQQVHAFWAGAAKQWVLVYLDQSDLTKLQVTASPDFVTWNQLMPAPFSGPIADGRDFGL